MGNDADRTDGIAKIREMIEGIEFAMLTTMAEDGSLHGRPMATQKAEFDGTLWFFTQASSHKVAELESDHRVGLAYTSTDNRVWIALSGTARLVRDRAKMEELWTKDVEIYFKDGLEDPDIALLEVSVERGEYWEGPGAIAYVVEVAKALVTGEPSQFGEHEKIEVG
jgi:general stress protein 26